MLDEFQDKWMTREHEQELAASARQGDMVALDELILFYLPAFQRMTLSFYSNPLDAEDFLQETLKKVMNQISGFEGKSRFTTWVYKVMRSTFCDELRRQKKLPPRQSFDAGESPEATLGPMRVPHQAPEIPNGDPDSAAIIRELIDKLPLRQRKVTQYYYLDELPLLKVAELLGVPYSRVRKDASEAIKTLKRMSDGKD